MKENQFIFTVPPPYPQISFTINLQKGEGEKELHERITEFFNSNEFKKMGVLEGGKFQNPATFQSNFYYKKETIYPKEFYEVLTSKEQELAKKIFEELRSGKQYATVMGGYGDMEDCDAIVEKKIESIKDGVLTKFWGCDFLFKSYPEQLVIEGISLGKAVLSIIPRKSLANNLVLKAVLIFMFLFRKKKLLELIHTISYVINYALVEKFGGENKKYNKAIKELKRNIDFTLKYMLEDEGILTDKPLIGDIQFVKSKAENKRLLWRIIANFAEFFYLFIQNDSAYRFRLQDFLSEANRDNANKSVIKETKRLIKLALSRENEIKDKIRKIGGIFILLLYLSKRLRKFMLVFYTYLDTDKIRLDKDDWYFCLRRKGYNYGGKSLRERLEEADRIDKERDHVHLQLIFVRNEKTQQQLPAIKITRPV